MLMLVMGCGKDNPPDGYIILYNDAGKWTYASPTESGHNQSLRNYSSKKAAIREAWKYFRWIKKRIDNDNWHEYKEDKR